jgi:hypothetical protein
LQGQLDGCGVQSQQRKQHSGHQQAASLYLLNDLLTRLRILGEQTHSYMSQSEIDKGIGILNQSLSQCVYAHENHSEPVRQEKERGDAAQARKHFARAYIEYLARERSQRSFHTRMQFLIRRLSEATAERFIEYPAVVRRSMAATAAEPVEAREELSTLSIPRSTPSVREEFWREPTASPADPLAAY